MRLLRYIILLAALSTPGMAEEKVLQSFDGSAAQNTPTFQVPDKWEMRWDAADVLSLTLLTPDGTIVTGIAAAQKGSIYFPRGGRFSLQVNPSVAESSAQWHVTLVDMSSTLAAGEVSDPANYLPPAINSAPSTLVPAVAATTTTPPVPPIPTSPDATTNAAPLAVEPAKLTDAQAHAVVLVKGDYGEGTGFLVKTPDGPAVVTNVHVIFANPNVKITTTRGEQIKVLGLKGASDRDLAIFSIEDNHYSFMEMTTDLPGTVQPGDEVITPGNSEGGGVMLSTRGKVVGIGPEQIEFDNPIYHGNSGGPVFHVKSGKVIAVVTQAMKVDTTNALDRASFANRNSAIANTMRYFGYRLDTVPKWEPYAWDTFLVQTTFLRKFHEQSRCIDSYLNGSSYEKEHVAGSGDDGYPSSTYYMRNEKLEKAENNYNRLTEGAGSSQRLNAARELMMTLENLADLDLASVKTPANFYSFIQIRASHEAKYRDSLKEEIAKVGGKLGELGH